MPDNASHVPCVFVVTVAVVLAASDVLEFRPGSNNVYRLPGGIAGEDADHSQFVGMQGVRSCPRPTLLLGITSGHIRLDGVVVFDQMQLHALPVHPSILEGPGVSSGLVGLRSRAV